MRLAAAALLAIGLLLWYLQSEDNASIRSGSSMQSLSSAQPIVTSAPNQHVEQTLVTIPELDNQLDWLQPRLKIVFDHFLLEYEQAHFAMWLAFDKYCSTMTDCQQITALFVRYVAYKESLVSIDESISDTHVQIEEKLDMLSGIRQEHFSDIEIEVLFGDERSWQSSALQRLAIRQNSSISDAEKQALLAQHYQSLSGLELESVTPSLQLEQLSELAKSNSINQDNYNQLAAEYGPQAAQRLIVMANKQKQWQQKLQNFAQQKRKLQSTLSGEELTDAIAKLTATMFTKNETKRLHALTDS